MSMFEQEGVLTGRPAAAALDSDRITFISRVYLMMFSGLVVFFLIGAGVPLLALQGIEPFLGLTNAIIGIPPLLMFLLVIGGSMGAHALAYVRGVNVLVFYAFAALMGVATVGLVGATVAAAGLVILIQALFLTVLTFGSISAFVLITRKDFGFLGGFLFAGMIALIGVVLIALLGQTFNWFPVTNAFGLGISFVAVLLFAGYILYNTSAILHRFSTDQVVPAALALMIDFIMMFRNILAILGIVRSND